MINREEILAVDHYSTDYCMMNCALKSRGNYGYAVKETVKFYIWKSKPLNKYINLCIDGSLIQSSINTEYSLAFCFICGYGNKDTFGKDKTIFV